MKGLSERLLLDKRVQGSRPQSYRVEDIVTVVPMRMASDLWDAEVGHCLPRPHPMLNIQDLEEEVSKRKGTSDLLL